MDASQRIEITEYLSEWRRGDQSAFERLLPLVYTELRRIAGAQMGGEAEGHVLQTTALINEAYLRLVDRGSMDWQNRAHFFAIAALTMRQILVDFARRNKRLRRGGGRREFSLDEVANITERASDDVLALNDALDRLSRMDQRKAKVVEMRFFGGMSVEETAEVLQVSPNTVIRDWSLARAWLRRELQDGAVGDPAGHDDSTLASSRRHLS